MIYLLLAISFLKVGLLSFGGGGYAMIPLIQKEVGHFGLSGKEFIDVLALSQITPGPIGINAATYTGYKVAGVAGSAVATFANVIPTFLIMVAAARVFYLVRANKHVEAFFAGIRPVFIGLIASSVIVMAQDIRLWQDAKGLAIFLSVFTAAFALRVNPILLIIVSGIIGFFLY